MPVGQGILSASSIPIPPPRLTKKNVEAMVGIEPAIRDLQSPALPLGYMAVPTLLAQK